MSTPIIQAKGLAKQYGNTKALSNIDFTLEPGRILGLIGPNGAGKTTLLKGLLGLAPVEGEIEVLGVDPKTERTQLLKDVCFIADTAILPRWMTVKQLLEFMQGAHPNFDHDASLALLKDSNIQHTSKVGELSKGMITRLHLALILAIDAKLLVLDEPTLGLDIINRRDFYSTILDEYFQNDRSIIITTHLVEEVEHILTDVMLLKDGHVLVYDEIDSLKNSIIEIETTNQNQDAALAHNPIYSKPTLGGRAFFYRNNKTELSHLGDAKIPSISDIFVALLQEGTENKELHHA